MSAVYENAAPGLVILAGARLALAFNRDPYKAVASMLFDIDVTEVTREHRKVGKAVVHYLLSMPIEEAEKTVVTVAIIPIEEK